MQEQPSDSGTAARVCMLMLHLVLVENAWQPPCCSTGKSPVWAVPQGQMPSGANCVGECPVQRCTQQHPFLQSSSMQSNVTGKEVHA